MIGFCTAPTRAERDQQDQRLEHRGQLPGDDLAGGETQTRGDSLGGITKLDRRQGTAVLVRKDNAVRMLLGCLGNQLPDRHGFERSQCRRRRPGSYAPGA